MATTLEELQIKFTAEMGGLNTQLNGVKQAVAGIEAPTGKASGALGNLAKMGKIIGGAAIGAKLISVGKEAIAMANDAVESESLFEVSMGGMADSTRAWSEDLSKSLGLNAVEVRKSVGTFNVMFNSMGLGETQARDMSQGMTELAQDMASFYNLDPTEAFQKLSAGITGEAEPLKRLGILIDEKHDKPICHEKGHIHHRQGNDSATENPCPVWRDHGADEKGTGRPCADDGVTDQPTKAHVGTG